MQSGTGSKILKMLCLGAYLFSAMGVGGPMVWCAARDGHEAYERAHPVTPCIELGDSNRLAAFDRSTSGISVASQTFGSASPFVIVGKSPTTCVDTPMPAAQVNPNPASSRPRLLEIESYSIAPVSGFLAGEGDFLIRTPRLVESERPALSLTALRSVMLLI